MRKYRVGVITLYDLNNYGNRLQNHAVIACLEKLGVEAETVIIEREDRFRPLKCFLKALIGKIIKTKFSKFYYFTIIYTKPRWFYCPKSIVNDKIIKRYHAFSVGSDQVWNSKYLAPNSKSVVLQERLLAFADSSKRLAFSASFSVQDIPEEDKIVFYNQLINFPQILVRENRGKEIVKDLGLRFSNKKLNAKVILDPTMMLTADYWKSIASNSFQEKNYILELFLCPKSELADTALKKIKKEYACQIVNIFDHKYGPKEFIELISKARYICTDSFHAVAFSILFEKNFMVFERSDNSQQNDSRFITLFKRLKIDSRIVKKFADIDKIWENVIDYKNVSLELKEAQNYSWRLLKNAFQKLELDKNE